MLKHREVVKEWLHNEYAVFYVEFLEGLREVYRNQLVHNHLDEKDRDVSPAIRGRVYELEDLLALPDQLDTVENLQKELKALEIEGYTNDREPRNVRPATN